jgi:membrane fusion protein (multidrug efflux system)
VTEGALVTSQQSTPLALVQQLDPIYVDITQSSVEMLKLQRALASGDLQRDEKNEAEVSLTLEDGSEYSERGKLQFAEVSVDPSTGAVVLRALFPNPQRELLPGMFVRAQLTKAMKSEALLVPQRGVTRNQRGDAVVLVVGDGNRVAERMVTTARVIGNDWLIDTGLRAGERVILDGLQKVRPGTEVKPVELTVEQSSAGGQAAAGVAQR